MAERAPSLRQLQESFWALISAPSGVRDAASAQPRHAALLEHVSSDAQASSLARLDLYANMYFYRLHENLQQDVPRLLAVLGEVAFHNLITDYLWACPSQQPSARYVGARLAEFLRSHPLSHERPWLSSLAALEWARVDVVDRLDQPLLSLDALQAFAAGGFAELTLALVAAHEVVRSSFAIDALFHTPSAPATDSCSVLVWRAVDLTVQQRCLTATECLIWERLAAGLSFVDLCSALLESLEPAEAAQRAVVCLTDWAGSGLLVAR